MAGGDVEIVRTLYGFNWAALDSQEAGFARSAAVIGDDFRAQVSPEIGERTLAGLDGFRLFVEAVELDFRDLRYEPERFIEAPGGRVVVVGEICGTGRASNIPFRSPFGHVWTMRDGKAVSVEAHLDHGDALAAAGVAE